MLQLDEEEDINMRPSQLPSDPMPTAKKWIDGAISLSQLPAGPLPSAAVLAQRQQGICGRDLLDVLVNPGTLPRELCISTTRNAWKASRGVTKGILDSLQARRDALPSRFAMSAQSWSVVEQQLEERSLAARDSLDRSLAALVFQLFAKLEEHRALTCAILLARQSRLATEASARDLEKQLRSFAVRLKSETANEVVLTGLSQ